MSPSSSRRIFGLPAWCWVLLPVPLLAVAHALPSLWPPGKLNEWNPRGEIFREPVLVTRVDLNFHFVAYGSHENTQPLWTFDVASQEFSNTCTQDRAPIPGLLPGLFRREAKWTYQLTVEPYTTEGKKVAAATPALNETDVKLLKELLITEMSKRKQPGQAVSKLHDYLVLGQTRTTYLCPQNLLILLSWLSLPLAAFALVVLFRPGSNSTAKAQPVS